MVQAAHVKAMADIAAAYEILSQSRPVPTGSSEENPDVSCVQAAGFTVCTSGGIYCLWHGDSFVHCLPIVGLRI